MTKNTLLAYDSAQQIKALTDVIEEIETIHAKT